MLKTIGRSVVMAFSTFSRIPMPQVQWTEDSMRYSMCAFPLIGACIAGLSALWLWICNELGLTDFFAATGLLVCAILVSGGIHLDGFGDVIDALSSHAEAQRKIEILKDPHIGAFGVIGIAIFLIAMVAVLNELCHMISFGRPVMISLLMVPIMGRTLSAASTLMFPRNASNGMLSSFQQGAHKRTSFIIVIIEFCIVACIALFFCLPVGIAIIAGMLLVLVFVKIQSTRQFGGYSGDLAGYFLSLAELVALFFAIFALKAVFML